MKVELSLPKKTVLHCMAVIKLSQPSAAHLRPAEKPAAQIAHQELPILTSTQLHGYTIPLLHGSQGDMQYEHMFDIWWSRV